MPDPLSFRIKKLFDRYIHDPITAINVTKRTSVGVGGVQTVIADRTFIEEDSTTRTSAMTAFDTANEVKAVIATGISTFNEDTTTNIDRLLFAHYTYDSGNDASYAVINAADLTGLADQADLASSDAFEVIGIARLVGPTEGTLGTLGGYNLKVSKPSGFGGA